VIQGPEVDNIENESCACDAFAKVIGCTSGPLPTFFSVIAEMRVEIFDGGETT